MPCALRTRPTIVSSGAVTLGRRVAGRAALANRHGGRVELARETRLVASLEQSRLSQERTHGVARQRTVVEPIVRPLGLELNGLVALTREILPDDLDEAAIARARGFGDHDSKRWRVLPAGATKANANCHGACLLIGVLVVPTGSSRIRRFRIAPVLHGDVVRRRPRLAHPHHAWRQSHPPA